MSSNKTPQKYPLDVLIGKMDPEHQHVSRRILEDYSNTIASIPASHVKHHAWEGGYISHVEETMNIALRLHETLSACRQLPFNVSDVLFCAFLHDFDKVQRYTMDRGRLASKGAYNSDYIDTARSILKDKYGYALTPDEYNALKYAHGEGKDYHPTDRIMQPLAALIHCSDTISARIWFDKGRGHNTWAER